MVTFLIQSLCDAACLSIYIIRQLGEGGGVVTFLIQSLCDAACVSIYIIHQLGWGGGWSHSSYKVSVMQHV